MIEQIKYAPIIKTGDAELKALANLDSKDKSLIFPIIELTRGKKSRNDTIGNLDKRINKLKEINLNGFFLDLTGDDVLSNIEIDILRSDTDGYKSWCNYCKKLKDIFPGMLPVIQIEESTDYTSYLNNLLQQVQSLLQEFEIILFRSQDENSSINIISDIKEILMKDTTISPDRICYLLDYRFIKDDITGVNSATKFIDVLYNKLNIRNIIVSSTSFPNSVSEELEEDDLSGHLPMKEISFFNKIKTSIENASNLNMIYSDYASINPIRNDTVTMARGWIPRIDIPTFSNNIEIIRKKRKNSNYADRYKEVAYQVVQKEYFQNLQNKIHCWGIDEIIKASQGNVSGSTPQFWISVRMNIYLNLMLNKFYH